MQRERWRRTPFAAGRPAARAIANHLRPGRRLRSADRAPTAAAAQLREDRVRRGHVRASRGRVASARDRRCDARPATGFDLACAAPMRTLTSPRCRSCSRSRSPPSCSCGSSLVVDAARRSRPSRRRALAVDTKGRRIILLLGNQLGPAGELARAIEDARKKSPTAR